MALRGNIHQDQILDPAATPGNVPIYDADGSLVDSGSAVGGLSGITQLTGDVTAGPGNGSQAATLANTAVTPGSYTSADITVDSKGRVTAATNGTGGGGGGGSVIGTASFDGLSGISNLVVRGVVANVTRVSAGRYTLTFTANQANYVASILANSGLSIPFTTYIDSTDTTPPAAGFTFATVNIIGPSAADSPLVMVTICKI